MTPGSVVKHSVCLAFHSNAEVFRWNVSSATERLPDAKLPVRTRRDTESGRRNHRHSPRTPRCGGVPVERRIRFGEAHGVMRGGDRTWSV